MEEITGMLTGLKRGDRDAERIFWKDRWPEVYAVCRHILGDGADASEAAVDVMTDFMTKYVHSLSNEAAINAYLRLMAVRRSIKYKKFREKHISLQPDTDMVNDDALSPEESAQFAFLVPRLNECMGRLTGKARQAVQLRYAEQMTGDRIGGIIGASKQYVGRLLKQSLNFLSRCLEERQGEATKTEGGTQSK